MGLYTTQWIHREIPRNRSRPFPYLTYGAQAKPGRSASTTKALSDLTVNGYGLENPIIHRAYVNAFDDFTQKAKQSLTISGGENLGESRKTLEMIANRSKQLQNIAKKAVAVEEKRKRKRKLKWRRRYIGVPGGWWLEYHLAWRPVIQDIYNGCRMLSEPVWETTPVLSSKSTTERINRSHPRDWRFAEVDISDIKAYVRIQGNVKVTNPNAYLLNRTGLINPVLIAWQLSPLTMFIDWMWNVSGFLQSYTDQVGWTLERGQLAMKDTCVNTHIIENPWDTPDNNVRLTSAWRFQRELISTLPIPDFLQRGGSGISSISRGTTAIAVLLGILGKGPR